MGGDDGFIFYRITGFINVLFARWASGDLPIDGLIIAA
jgi:hypothetical protein